MTERMTAATQSAPPASRTAHPRIVALDLSLTGTGVCLPDGQTRVIHTKLRGMERLTCIRGNLAVLFYQCDPELVVVEGYSYHSKGSSAVSLGELGGVVRMYLHEKELPYVEIPPACRAKYATGKGNAPKDLVLQEAVHRSGRIFGDNNQADAWWLWQMALAHYAPESPLFVPMPVGNLATLAKVPWAEVGRRAA